MKLTTSRSGFDKLLTANRVVSVCREVFADADTPVAIYRKLAADRPGTFLLESASQGGIWARYSFVGAGTFGVLSEQGGKALWQPAEGGVLSEERLLPGGVASLEPLAALEAVHTAWASEQVPGLPPLTSGLVGYVGWEAVREIYGINPAHANHSSVPRQSLSFVSELVVIDQQEGSVILIANVLNDADAAGADVGADELWADAQARLDELQTKLASPLASPLAILRPAEPDFVEVTDREQFLADVLTAKEHIAADDVSQVVISQRFDANLQASALDLYRVLRHTNPSPFLYLLSFVDANSNRLSIVGSSPEALITVNNGRVVTHPIAGSRPRGKTLEEDLALEVELLADAKEISEHEMLVDLSREDLAKVCDPDTIEVNGYMRIERFSHVMHIVSTVEGDLAAGNTALGALRATFPAGTLSGAPKPKSLEIIDALEPVSRGVYGGVVGYFAFGGDADMAIAIRTATISAGVAQVQAGAGIVAGSIPQNEDQETRNKAAAPLRAIAIANALQKIETD